MSRQRIPSEDSYGVRALDDDLGLPPDVPDHGNIYRSVDKDDPPGRIPEPGEHRETHPGKHYLKVDAEMAGIGEVRICRKCGTSFEAAPGSLAGFCWECRL